MEDSKRATIYFDAAVHHALRLKAAATDRTKRDRQWIVVRIQSLAAEPRLAGYEKLAGIASRYRIRQGLYRVVYSVDDARRLVEVVKVARRREIYRSTS